MNKDGEFCALPMLVSCRLIHFSLLNLHCIVHRCMCIDKGYIFKKKNNSEQLGKLFVCGVYYLTVLVYLNKYLPLATSPSMKVVKYSPILKNMCVAKNI